VTVNQMDNSVSVLANRGDGSFEARRDYETGGDPNWLAIDDLNGDGKLDLATANYTAHSVSVLFNRGDGSFTAKVDYPTGHGPVSVAIDDLNGDGKQDLATSNEAHSVSVLLNDGSGSFRPRRDYSTGGTPASDAGSPNAVAIGDLNGDGKADLVTASEPAKVSVFVKPARSAGSSE
jgi:FG-GAP-like repeat/FG-GAP repeat